MNSKSRIEEERAEDKAPASYVVEQAQGLLEGVLIHTDIDIQGSDLSTLEGLEALVIDMARRRRIASLIVALAIVHIRNAHLYPDTMTWTEYRLSCKDRVGIGYQDIWRYERIGEAYTTYYHDLHKIGFNPSGGGITKLMMLPAASAKYGRRKAVLEFGRLGIREYTSWVKGRPAPIPYKGGKGSDFGVTADGLTFRSQIVIKWVDITVIARAGKLDRLQAAISSIKREK